jgi:HAD superfamily hydrolase (TIGR01509 family)
MRFTTVIFDMDGTLFDTERLTLNALQTVLERFDIAIPRQALESVIGLDGKRTEAVLMRFIPPSIGVAGVLKPASALIKSDIEAHGLPLKKGAMEILAYLKARGTAIGLATSTSTERALDNLRRSNLTDYFQATIGGDQVAHGKPHPDIYLKALAELRASPDDAIAVEDSDHGIRSAVAAGMRVVHVPDIKQIDVETRALAHREYASLLDFRDDLTF